jgi:hypothetical protein
MTPESGRKLAFFARYLDKIVISLHLPLMKIERRSAFDPLSYPELTLYTYCNLALTNDGVSRLLGAGFTRSVYLGDFCMFSCVILD